MDGGEQPDAAQRFLGRYQGWAARADRHDGRGQEPRVVVAVAKVGPVLGADRACAILAKRQIVQRRTLQACHAARACNEKRHGDVPVRDRCCCRQAGQRARIVFERGHDAVVTAAGLYMDPAHGVDTRRHSVHQQHQVKKMQRLIWQDATVELGRAMPTVTVVSVRAADPHHAIKHPHATEPPRFERLHESCDRW